MSSWVRCGYDGGWGKWSEKNHLKKEMSSKLEIEDIMSMLKDDKDDKSLRRYVCAKRVLHVYKSGNEWRN